MATPLTTVNSNSTSSSSKNKQPQESGRRDNVSSGSMKLSTGSTLRQRHRALLLQAPTSNDLPKKQQPTKPLTEEKAHVEQKETKKESQIGSTSSTRLSEKAARASLAFKAYYGTTNNKAIAESQRDEIDGITSQESNSENQPIEDLKNNDIRTNKSAAKQSTVELDRADPNPTKSNAGVSTTTSFKRWTSIALSNVVNNANGSSSNSSTKTLMTTAGMTKSNSSKSLNNSKNKDEKLEMEPVQIETGNVTSDKKQINAVSASGLGRTRYRFTSTAQGSSLKKQQKEDEKDLASDDKKPSGQPTNTNLKIDTQLLSNTTDGSAKGSPVVTVASPTAVPSSIRMRYGRSAVRTAKKRSPKSVSTSSITNAAAGFDQTQKSSDTNETKESTMMKCTADVRTNAEPEQLEGGRISLITTNESSSNVLESTDSSIRSNHERKQFIEPSSSNEVVVKLESKSLTASGQNGHDMDSKQVVPWPSVDNDIVHSSGFISSLHKNGMSVDDDSGRLTTELSGKNKDSITTLNKSIDQSMSNSSLHSVTTTASSSISSFKHHNGSTLIKNEMKPKDAHIVTNNVDVERNTSGEVFGTNDSRFEEMSDELETPRVSNQIHQNVLNTSGAGGTSSDSTGHGSVLQSWRNKIQSKTTNDSNYGQEVNPERLDGHKDTMSKKKDYTSPGILVNTKTIQQITPIVQEKGSNRSGNVAASWISRNQTPDTTVSHDIQAERVSIRDLDRFANGPLQSSSQETMDVSRSRKELASAVLVEECRDHEIIEQTETVSPTSDSNVFSFWNQSKSQTEQSNFKAIAKESQVLPWKAKTNPSCDPNTNDPALKTTATFQSNHKSTLSTGNDTNSVATWKSKVKSPDTNCSGCTSNVPKHFSKDNSLSGIDKLAATGLQSIASSKTANASPMKYSATTSALDETSVTSSSVKSAPSSVLDSWRNRISNNDKQLSANNLGQKGYNSTTSFSGANASPVKYSIVKSPEANSSIKYGQTTSASWKPRTGTSDSTLQGQRISNHASWKGFSPTVKSGNEMTKTGTGTLPAQVSLTYNRDTVVDHDDDSTLSETLTQYEGTEATLEESYIVIESDVVDVATRRSLLMQKLKNDACDQMQAKTTCSSSVKLTTGSAFSSNMYGGSQQRQNKSPVRVVASHGHNELHNANSYDSNSYTCIGSMAPIDQTSSCDTTQTVSENCDGPSQFKKKVDVFNKSASKLVTHDAVSNSVANPGTSTPVRSNKFKLDDNAMKKSELSPNKKAKSPQRYGKDSASSKKMYEPSRSNSLSNLTAGSGISAVKAQLWGSKVDDGGSSLTVPPIQEALYRGTTDVAEKQLTPVEKDLRKVSSMRQMYDSAKNTSVGGRNAKETSPVRQMNGAYTVNLQKEQVLNKCSPVRSVKSVRPDVSTPHTKKPFNRTESSSRKKDLPGNFKSPAVPGIDSNSNFYDTPKRSVFGNSANVELSGTSLHLDHLYSNKATVADQLAVEGSSIPVETTSSSLQNTCEVQIEVETLDEPLSAYCDHERNQESLGAEIPITNAVPPTLSQTTDSEETFKEVDQAATNTDDNIMPSRMSDSKKLRQPSVGDWKFIESLSPKDTTFLASSEQQSLLTEANAKVAEEPKERRRIYDLLNLDLTTTDAISNQNIEADTNGVNDENVPDPSLPELCSPVSRKEDKPWFKDQHTLSPETWQARRVYDLDAADGLATLMNEPPVTVDSSRTSQPVQSNSLVQLAADSIHAVDYEEAMKHAPNNHSLMSEDGESRESIIPLDAPHNFTKVTEPSSVEINESAASDSSSIVFGNPAAFGSAGGYDESVPPLKVAFRAKAIEKWNGGLGVPVKKKDNQNKQEIIRKEIGRSLSSIGHSNDAEDPLNVKALISNDGEAMKLASSDGFWVADENNKHWEQDDPHFGISNDYDVFELSLAPIPAIMKENSSGFQNIPTNNNDDWVTSVNFPTIERSKTMQNDGAFNPFVLSNDEDDKAVEANVSKQLIDVDNIKDVSVDNNNDAFQFPILADETNKKWNPVVVQRQKKSLGGFDGHPPNSDDSFDPFASEEDDAAPSTLVVNVQQETKQQQPSIVVDPFAVDDPFSINVITSFKVHSDTKNRSSSKSNRKNNKAAFDPFSDEEEVTLSAHPKILFVNNAEIEEDAMFGDRSRRSTRSNKYNSDLKGSGYDADHSNLNDSVNVEI